MKDGITWLLAIMFVGIFFYLAFRGGWVVGEWVFGL